jgi:hypothetical protein
VVRIERSTLDRVCSGIILRIFGKKLLEHSLEVFPWVILKIFIQVLQIQFTQVLVKLLLDVTIPTAHGRTGISAHWVFLGTGAQRVCFFSAGLLGVGLDPTLVN